MQWLTLHEPKVGGPVFSQIVDGKVPEVARGLINLMQSQACRSPPA